jgi:hypothetical protein
MNTLQQATFRCQTQLMHSPHLLSPKWTPQAAPHWVNDYRILNVLKVTNHFPLPQVEEILTDATKGCIWSKIDMTNSYFHTQMCPEDVNYMAVSMPYGLYEWLVMPMGLKNAPPLHQ